MDGGLGREVLISPCPCCTVLFLLFSRASTYFPIYIIAIYTLFHFAFMSSFFF
jgi:hypothetical protein